MSCIFTIDVEDWFHILDIPGGPPIGSWLSLESRVERNFLLLLDLADQHGVKTTCFFLGWIGEHFPHLVREAHRRGHEIASHGYAHRLVYELTPQEFREDAEKARRILEDVAGCRVTGFRAPGFSVTKATPWFFEQLANSGYLYDSSIFPARRGHGGLEEAGRDPFIVYTSSGAAIIEFPMTVAGVAKPMCFFGGGYLRLFPWPVIRTMTQKCLNDKRTVIFYVHPREIDVDHPRLPMNRMRTFKSYVNLNTTQYKIEQILKTFHCDRFHDEYTHVLATLDPGPRKFVGAVDGMEAFL